MAASATSEKHESLKTKLADVFRKSGHVAEHAVEELAEAAATIAMAAQVAE